MNHTLFQLRQDKAVRFEFLGSAKDYFPIWVFNMTLTVISCGLYWPWAKLRKMNYFYGNTRLDDASFHFAGNPYDMLLGRVIAISMLLIYWFASDLIPNSEIYFIAAAGVIFPWAVTSAFGFRNRNTIHRGLRFNFDANYGEAFVAYALLPALTPFTLGLLWPYAVFRQKRYRVGQSRYGDKQFTFLAEPTSFYIIYAVAFVGAIIFGLISLFIPPEHTVIYIIITILSYAIIMVFVRTAVQNLVFNAARCGDLLFQSNLRSHELLWIYITNIAAIVVSLGACIPWAQIRLARYRLCRIQATPVAVLRRFVAGKSSHSTATGDEIGNAFSIDL